ncbi:hypothetical protein EOM86_04420, partial [Candidatus Nomurabacteria bacterium]|nr:hypothetical protein [Candidatus Nomurabacteria bacterium]
MNKMINSIMIFAFTTMLLSSCVPNENHDIMSGSSYSTYSEASKNFSQISSTEIISSSIAPASSYPESSTEQTPAPTQTGGITPSSSPSPSPVSEISSTPSATPTVAPTAAPTVAPTAAPTVAPPATPAVTPVPEPVTGFRVEETRLLDANGNEYVMRGVNHANSWFQEKLNTAIPAIAAAGANTVRLVLNNGTSPDFGYHKS